LASIKPATIGTSIEARFCAYTETPGKGF